MIRVDEERWICACVGNVQVEQGNISLFYETLQVYNM
jgi:hypothetical protein